MTVTATSMKLKFPEFADLDDGTIEFAIEEASLSISTDNWSSRSDLGVMYLAAHYLSAGKVAANDYSGDSGGTIASESIGRLSITYKTNPASNANAVTDDYTSSSYGRRFIELRGLLFGGPVVV